MANKAKADKQLKGCFLKKKKRSEKKSAMWFFVDLK